MEETDTVVPPTTTTSAFSAKDSNLWRLGNFVGVVELALEEPEDPPDPDPNNFW
jgi:hypothetical protein